MPVTVSIRSSFRGVARKSRAALAVIAVAATTASAQAPVQAPVPTVPEIFTAQGEFVRIAYNNEGWTTLGYRMAQEQVGQEWILLQVGFTLRRPAKDYKLKREHLSVTTPDGAKVKLATQQEYHGGMGATAALNMRAKVNNDSINYFPNDVSRGCAVQFFADDNQLRALAFDEVDLSYTRGCFGRLYFKIPGGVKVGQHWLNVQFAGGELQVPFRILTKDEEKESRKRWEEIKKAHDEMYKKS